MKAILNIVNVLEQGKLVIFPTETVYGLAGRADKTEPIRKIYSLKNRPLSKPLSVFIKNIKDISNFTILEEHNKRIINYFLPGSVTFILDLQNRNFLDSHYFRFQKTIGIRIPNHPIALAVLKYCSFPLVVTSVNISSESDVINAKNIPQNIQKDVDLIVDDDVLVKGVQSTVIDLTTKSPTVIRNGAVKESNILCKKLI